jgi:hypothetical protein
MDKQSTNKEMHCFKLTVHEDRFTSSSSREVLIKTMREACKALHQMPNGQTGVLFAETDVFPKEYYFNTLSKPLFNKLSATWKVEPIQCRDPSKLLTGQIHCLGNRDLVSPFEEKSRQQKKGRYSNKELPTKLTPSKST